MTDKRSPNISNWIEIGSSGHYSLFNLAQNLDCVLQSLGEQVALFQPSPPFTALLLCICVDITSWVCACGLGFLMAFKGLFSVPLCPGVILVWCHLQEAQMDLTSAESWSSTNRDFRSIYTSYVESQRWWAELLHSDTHTKKQFHTSQQLWQLSSHII